MNKILFISRLSPFYNSRVRFIAERLSDIGDVDVISGRMKINKEWESRFKVIEKGLISSVNIMIRAFNITYFNMISIFHVLTRRYEIIICADVPYALGGLLGKILMNKKFILDAHEIVWDMGYGKFISWLYFMLEKIVLGKCDLLLVPSEERAQIILGAHGINKRFVVIENFPLINDDKKLDRKRLCSKIESMGIKDKNFIVMYQGSITSLTEKGLLYLIELTKKLPFLLVIQGAGPKLYVLREFYCKIGSGKVLFLDPCNNDESIEWISGADLSFICYDPNNLNNQYACSSKFYTSVFAGVPILCNRLRSFEIFSIKFGGIKIFDHIEKEEIEKALKELICNSHYLDRIKKEITRASEYLMKVDRAAKIISEFKEL